MFPDEFGRGGVEDDVFVEDAADAFVRGNDFDRVEGLVGGEEAGGQVENSVGEGA